MFGYTGDDLAVFGILFTSGLAITMTGIALGGWRHKALVWGLIGFGVFVCLLGVGWGEVKNSFPRFGQLVIAFALPLNQTAVR